jgi:hypothetical protein
MDVSPPIIAVLPVLHAPFILSADVTFRPITARCAATSIPACGIVISFDVSPKLVLMRIKGINRCLLVVYIFIQDV